MVYEQIKSLLVTKVRHKLASYKPETTHMPFHCRLLGKNRLALYSFIHSVNTMFGQSIFEQVAVLLAKSRGLKAENQFKLQGYISDQVVLEIDRIERELKSASSFPDKMQEANRVKLYAIQGDMGKLLTRKVDVYLESEDTEYFFEIKTVKPNMQSFKAIKKQLLEWIALKSSREAIHKIIKTAVIIPYNPYEPEPYERWTLQGLFDLKEEILVGKEFWDLVGGIGAYEALLNTFEVAGIELCDEIDSVFNKYSLTS